MSEIEYNKWHSMKFIQYLDEKGEVRIEIWTNKEGNTEWVATSVN